jgi:hypothetical protein
VVFGKTRLNSQLLHKPPKQNENPGIEDKARIAAKEKRYKHCI